jgi:choline dehydrogenase-like flavoprotein
MKPDFLVVGAGFAGSVCAERLASAERHAPIIDRRPHIGGNAFDTYDENGILIHPYGLTSFIPAQSAFLLILAALPIGGFTSIACSLKSAASSSLFQSIG